MKDGTVLVMAFTTDAYYKKYNRKHLNKNNWPVALVLSKFSFSFWSYFIHEFFLSFPAVDRGALGINFSWRSVLAVDIWQKIDPCKQITTWS